ncbi:hypothetical protein CK203_012817 [Vitis vinifera]|uniref:Uncharacterized protein n=1 Tax=Vitis vinifera TaxID=29760 RepID=A0A438JLT6_VITVI|nr:hypothetical protein CK203_012817 [Vitis vinifera]
MGREAEVAGSVTAEQEVVLSIGASVQQANVLHCPSQYQYGMPIKHLSMLTCGAHIALGAYRSEHIQGDYITRCSKIWKGFGGQLLGQALAAASKTVDCLKVVHSLHAYFLLVGDFNRHASVNLVNTEALSSFILSLL